MSTISERNRFLEQARTRQNREWAIASTAGELSQRPQGWEIWIANVQPMVSSHVARSIPHEQQSKVLKTIWDEFSNIYRDTGRSSEIKPTDLVRDIARVAVARPDNPNFSGVVDKYVSPVWQEGEERRAQQKIFEARSKVKRPIRLYSNQAIIEKLPSDIALILLKEKQGYLITDSDWQRACTAYDQAAGRTTE